LRALPLLLLPTWHFTHTFSPSPLPRGPTYASYTLLSAAAGRPTWVPAPQSQAARRCVTLPLYLPLLPYNSPTTDHTMRQRWRSPAYYRWACVLSPARAFSGGEKAVDGTRLPSPATGGLTHRSPFCKKQTLQHLARGWTSICSYPALGFIPLPERGSYHVYMAGTYTSMARRLPQLTAMAGTATHAFPATACHPAILPTYLKHHHTPATSPPTCLLVHPA